MKQKYGTTIYMNGFIVRRHNKRMSYLQSPSGDWRLSFARVRAEKLVLQEKAHFDMERSHGRYSLGDDGLLKSYRLQRTTYKSSTMNSESKPLDGQEVQIPQDFLNYMHDKAQEAGDNLVIFQEQRTGYTAGYKAGGIAAYRKILEMITASNQRYSDVILDVRNAQKELATIKKLYALCVDERREQARLLESPEPPTPVLPEVKEGAIGLNTILRDATEIEKFLESELSFANAKIKELETEIQEMLLLKKVRP